ncbi:MAG TPA: hypothetical protein PLW37_14740, partial [bacterium]|nr:hypothetical protein [bacterium]
NTTDDFEICHVYYDDNNCCEAIEFFNDIELIFNGVNLFEEKMDNIIELLLKTDKKIEKEKNMITSKALGLSIYFLDREPKSILVFSDNYYS